MFDGKAFGQEVVATVKGYVDKAVSALTERIDALEKREPLKGEKGLDGERGADGAAGKDGTNGIDGKDGAPGLPGADGMAGDQGEKGVDGIDGKDGVGLAGALIDRSGALVVTLTDGTTRELGPVVGKDGNPGEKGPDGQNGKDGADGLGFDDLEVTHDGERGFAFKFTRGDVVKEFKFAIPAMIYRGVFKDGLTYGPGDTVTWGGSLWHCGEETGDKPETSKSWTLAAKRGRDGKDGKQGEKGLEGSKGKDGRDLTQIGPDGSKW